ncbi:hypothetical protein ACFVH7_26335 [Kitasatospora indigofera]|uniref:hypothetical protein n=1 Tax=Kitasatospora indigofera TaxID=67307 RepID=UPI00362E78D8
MGKRNGIVSVSPYQAPRWWQLWKHPDLASDGWECMLYSDTELTSAARPSIPVGPSLIFPTGTESADGTQPTAQLVLRIPHADPQSDHPFPLAPDAPPRSPAWWIDMEPDDEVAALLSLALGIRMRSGSLVRRLPGDGFSAGVPELHWHRPPGLIPVPRRLLQLPGLRGETRDLQPGIDFLHLYPDLDPTEAFVLAKAARHYADALWIADSDPEQAWLRLVTALEVAAVHVQVQEADPVAAFTEAYPKTAKAITDDGGAALPVAAREFARLIGAGRRFRSFVGRYAPVPPALRPLRKGVRFEWAGLDQAMKDIYGYRSALLHEGRPFPPMMTGLALEVDENGAFDECPHSDSLWSSGTADWPLGAAPMYLWLFAYIVRGALMAWTNDCVVRRQPAMSGRELTAEPEPA